MPSLNRKAVLERIGDQREPHDYPHILINRSDIYRYVGLPQIDERCASVARAIGPGLDVSITNVLHRREEAPGRHVSVPRVRESRAAMECKVTEVVQFKSEKVKGWLVLGEVVAVYIDKALIKDGVYQTALANPILRAGRGGDYVEVT